MALGLALPWLLGCDLPVERPGEGGPRVVRSEPAPGHVDVDRQTTFRVWFDRRLFPRDVHRGHVAVESGGRGVYLGPRFDPVDRVLVVENLSGPLDPDVTWRLRVEGMRDLDGRPMAGPYEIAFDTGPDAIGEPAAAPPSFGDVRPILRRCATDGCHGPEEPALGLDLSSPEGIAQTAIEVPAVQTTVGTQGDAVWHASAGLSGIARIEVTAGVGRPSRSYLLYKVLGDPHIGGERMPPAPAPPLSPTELRLLSAWILGGAPLP